MKRKTVFQALLFVSIVAITLPTLAVEPNSPSPAETPPMVSSERMTVVLQIDDGPGLAAVPTSGGATASVQAVLADVNLELDDGSIENNVGLVPPTEFIFLNRFTPSPCDFSFDLEQIRVYFDTGNNLAQVGDDIRLVVYENTSGSVDPAIGSNFLAAFDATVQVADGWNIYDLSTPVHLDGPGDVLIGVIALEAPAPEYYPAAQDQTHSERRSWAGWWVSSPPPDPPTLPPNAAWMLIDDANPDLAGNWMIRGYGSYGTKVPAIVLEPEHQRGVGENNDVMQYDLRLTNCSGQQDWFDINYSWGWPVSGPDQVGSVPDGSSTVFQVAVTIPADAGCAECDLLGIEAVAQSLGTISDTATIETCAAERWQQETVGSGWFAAQPAQWAASTCTDDYPAGGRGTCFYVGGISAAGAVTGYAQKFDIAQNRWTRLSAAPTPVFGATLGYIDGKLYLAGGYTKLDEGWGGTYKLQILNLANGLWSTGPDMPAWGGLTGAGASNGAVVDGKLHVVGGRGDDSAAGSDQHAAYDPVSNTWAHKAALPYTTGFFGATSGGGKLYVAGGYLGQNGFYAYDPGSDSWQELSPLPGGAGKKDPVLGYAPGCAGGVFLYGGDKGYWDGVQDSTWYWHAGANMWVNYPAPLHTATSAAGGGTADGRLWIFGGSAGAWALSPPPHESLGYCCPLSPPIGAVEGIVTDANTGQPVENASIWLSGVSDPEYSDETWTDAGGYYSFGPLLAGEYELEAHGYGYANSASTPLLIEADMAQWVPFVLDAAMPELQPKAVGVSLAVGDSGTFTMMLDNHGSGELHFHVSELPADSIVPIEDLQQTLAGSSRVDPQVYADLEATPDGSARFIVYMAEQADLTEAFAIKDRSARGWYVYNALRAAAQQSQAGLRAELDREGVAFESRIIVNALVVKGNLDMVNSIAARPEVAFVGADVAMAPPEPVETQPLPTAPDVIEWNVQRVRAPEVWSGFSVAGEDIVVSNIDTGVDYDHNALVGKYRGNLGGGSFDHNYNWWDPYGDYPDVPNDGYGHGTHTMGTMLGDDGGANQIGVAPGAEWMACRGCNNRTCLNAELLECAEFTLAPWDLTGANPDPDKRPDVSNNSWGGGQAQWWYNQVVYAWRAAGIFPAFSIGNEGPDCNTAADPGDMPNVIGVGASDISNSNAPGSPADFSNRGPAKFTGLLKPEVTAPGAAIRSSVPGDSYDSWGGTSMAAPHVAGQVALIWSAQPDLRGNVQLTQWVIQQTAQPLLVDQGYYCGGDTAGSHPNNQYGWGLIDAYEAVSMAVHSNWDVEWLAVDPEGGTVPPAGSADVELDFDAGALAASQCYNAHLKVEYNDPYVVEEFVPVALCVDWCLGLEDVSITGPLRQFVDQPGEYSYTVFPVTATLPITVEWSNGTTGTTASYAWGATGTYTIIITATNCEGTDPVSGVLEVQVLEVDTTVYLPIILRAHHP
jgi:subtilisin family serine protease